MDVAGRPPGRARPASFAPSSLRGQERCPEWGTREREDVPARCGRARVERPRSLPGPARPRPLPAARADRLGRARQRLDRARRARRPRASRSSAFRWRRAIRRSGARIEREGRAAARLAHPAIVALYGSGDDADAHYLVSELVEGPSLAWLYAHRSLDERLVLEIGSALAAALAHAHERGVVHRDVKPGERDRARVRRAPGAREADRLRRRPPLGRAAADAHRGRGRHARLHGARAGRRREAGPAADLYSLALTLYEGLAGRNPLRGETVAATARRVGGADAAARGACAATSPGAVRGDRPRARSRAAGARHARRIARRARSRARPLQPATPARGSRRDGRRRRRSPARARRRPTVRVATPSAPAPLRFRAPAAPAPRRARAPLPSSAVAGARTAPGGRARHRGAVRRLAVAAARGSTTAAATAVSAAALATVLAAISTSVGWLLLGPRRDRLARRDRAPGRGARCSPPALAPVPVLLARRPWLWSAPALGAGARARRPRRGGAGARRADRRRRCARAPRWARSPTGGWRSPRCFSGRRLRARAAGRGPRARELAGIARRCAATTRWCRCAPTRGCATAGLWALAAAVLPWIVRGPLAPERAIAAAVWAAALTVGGDRDRRAPGSAATAAPAGLLGARRRARGGRAACAPALAPTGGRRVAWTRSRGPCEQTTPRNDERSPQPRDQDRRPRRGGVRPRLPQRDHAGRAGAPARARDGSPPAELASSTPVPNEYVIWLSPADRRHFAAVEASLIDELAAHLLEHARAERLALPSRPHIELRTDPRLSLGRVRRSRPRRQPRPPPAVARRQGGAAPRRPPAGADGAGRRRGAAARLARGRRPAHPDRRVRRRDRAQRRRRHRDPGAGGLAPPRADRSRTAAGR